MECESIPVEGEGFPRRGVSALLHALMVLLALGSGQGSAVVKDMVLTLICWELPIPALPLSHCVDNAAT